MTCPNGHDETERVTNERGKRVCLACRRAYTNRANAARRHRTDEHIRSRREQRGVTLTEETNSANTQHQQ